MFGVFVGFNEPAAVPPGDTTAPVLISATDAANGSTGATIRVTTDEGNGTLYAVLSTSATAPTKAQVKAGQDHTGATAAWAGSQTIASAGQKTLNPTGLTHTTAYWAHFMHEDAAGNQSSVASGDGFTTDAPAAPANFSYLLAGTFTYIVPEDIDAYNLTVTVKASGGGGQGGTGGEGSMGLGDDFWADEGEEGGDGGAGGASKFLATEAGGSSDLIANGGGAGTSAGAGAPGGATGGSTNTTGGGALKGSGGNGGDGGNSCGLGAGGDGGDGADGAAGGLSSRVFTGTSLTELGTITVVVGSKGNGGGGGSGGGGGCNDGDDGDPGQDGGLGSVVGTWALA